jgi:hypothetical protein
MSKEEMGKENKQKKKKKRKKNVNLMNFSIP